MVFAFGTSCATGATDGVALDETHIHVAEEKRRTQTATHGEARTDGFHVAQLDILNRVGSTRADGGTERTELAEADGVAILHGGNHLSLKFVEHGEAVGLGHSASCTDVLGDALEGEGYAGSCLDVEHLYIRAGLLHGLYDVGNHNFVGFWS